MIINALLFLTISSHICTNTRRFPHAQMRRVVGQKKPRDGEGETHMVKCPDSQNEDPRCRSVSRCEGPVHKPPLLGT